MCEGHRHCTRYPVFKVRVHRMDRCNGLHADAQYQFCGACVRAVAYRINELLQDAYGYLVMPLACTVCGRKVSQLHDMFDVEYLRESA